MSSSAEANVPPTSATADRTAFTYSIIRVEPDPVRGEFINVGVAMVDDDGHYSKLAFNYQIKSRLTALGGGRLLQPVLAELGEVTTAYDVAGVQLRPELRTQPNLTKSELRDWAANRGGIVRMSAPRVVLADDPDVAFQTVFRRYVRAPQEPQASQPLTPEAERSVLRDRFVRALKRLQNFDPERVRIGGPVPGRRFHHWLDIAILGDGPTSAFAHAIPLGAADERAVFMHRGLVLEAAADVPPDAPRLALHDDPPEQRRPLFDETRSLLDEAHVELVSRSQVDEAVHRFDDTFWG